MESTINKKQKLSTNPRLQWDRFPSLEKICDFGTSERIAIKHFNFAVTETRITYSQLHYARNEISGILQNAEASRFIGIAADTPAQCLPALMLGILSSGRAFVCLPSCASEIKRMSTKLDIRHTFSCARKTRDLNTFTVHGQQMFLQETEEADRHSNGSRYLKEPDGAFAYAATTSGSTGKPKIVKVTHASIVANILDFKSILNMSERDVVAQLTPLTFDPSVIEIFLPLSCGAAILVASGDLRNDSDALLKTLMKSGVSVLQSTPSLLLQRWTSDRLKANLLGDETTLRILLLGGENFPNANALSEIRSPNNRSRIFDVYGITEVSCWACIREIREGDCPPGFGRTLSETILEVRDEEGRRVKEGEGVLYIGSNSRVCAIDDEDIKLLEPPVFRDTGDIVVVDENGHMNLKGRRGRRIKRYGTKVYLTDLENHVQELPFVENCYASFTENNQSLDLYFTLFDKTTSERDRSKYENDVSIHVKKLSDIYRPDTIVALNRFELTTNGKICKKFLKQVSRRFLRTSSDDGPNVAKTFEGIWRSLLYFEEEAGFLDSGGSSVIALRIANQLQEKSGYELPKLMSCLLRNENFNACREYISKEISNFSQHRQISTVAEKSPTNEGNGISKLFFVENSDGIVESYENRNHSTVECSVQFDYQKNEETRQFMGESTTKISVSEKIFPYQKCRGRSNFPELPNSDRKTTWTKCTNIRSAYYYDLGKCVDASPTIFSYSGGKNYITVGSHAGVICTAELTNGNPVEHWEVLLPDRIEASILVVNDFRGIVGSYDSFVYCLHLKTGEQFWAFQTGDIVKCTSVLCSKKETIFFGSYDRKMYCVSLKDGSEVWSVKVGNGGICATPCISDELDCVVFASLDGTCASLKQNSGVINWVHRLDYPVFSGPTILGSDLAVCDVTGNILCLSAVTGQTTRSVKIDGNIFSHLCLCNTAKSDLRNVLFASENGNVYKMNLPSGETEVTFEYVKNIGGPIASTPFTDGRIIVTARNDGHLIILDSINAEILYSFKLGGEIFSSPVIHEDFIVVGSRDNRLYVLLRHDDFFTEK